MKIVSKDFHKFTGVYTAIYMDPCRRSYILLVRKFRTSKLLDKWSPTSKLSNIKCSHYLDGRYIFFSCTRTPLSAISVKPAFLYLQIFSLRINSYLREIFPRVLLLGGNFLDLILDFLLLCDDIFLWNFE